MFFNSKLLVITRGESSACSTAPACFPTGSQKNTGGLSKNPRKQNTLDSAGFFQVDVPHTGTFLIVYDIYMSIFYIYIYIHTYIHTYIPLLFCTLDLMICWCAGIFQCTMVGCCRHSTSGIYIPGYSTCLVALVTQCLQDWPVLFSWGIQVFMGSTSAGNLSERYWSLGGAGMAMGEGDGNSMFGKAYWIPLESSRKMIFLYWTTILKNHIDKNHIEWSEVENHMFVYFGIPVHVLFEMWHVKVTNYVNMW